MILDDSGYHNVPLYYSTRGPPDICIDLWGSKQSKNLSGRHVYSY